MRQPSVHITKDQFLQLLEELEVKAFPVDAFFRLAAQRAINTRAVLVKNKKTNKQVTKVLLADKGDTQLTADIIYATRIKLKHRGVRKITEMNHRDWTLCKELTNICNQFAQDFGFDNAREAFIKYITIGFERMGKNCRNWLARLVGMSDNIFTYYSSVKEVEDDDNVQKTQKLFNIYNMILCESTGIAENSSLKDNPEKHLHFLQVRQLLDSKGWNYEDYLRAQFEAMAWVGGIPEPHNLYTQKAVDRYLKYMYKQHQNSPQEDTEETQSIWEMMNKNG